MCIPKESDTFRFAHVVIDILNNTEAELHCRAFFFKKKMIKIEIYEKCFCFSPIINKKDRYAHF